MAHPKDTDPSTILQSRSENSQNGVLPTERSGPTRRGVQGALALSVLGRHRTGSYAKDDSRPMPHGPTPVERQPAHRPFLQYSADHGKFSSHDVFYCLGDTTRCLPITINSLT